MLSQLCSANLVLCLQGMMVAPVIAADGYTYEMKAITKWLQQSHASPVTGLALAHDKLIPNLAISTAMDEVLL